MDAVVSLEIEELTARIRAVCCKAGLADPAAAAVSPIIAAGERDGCNSHGIYRIEGCLRTIKAGQIALDAEPVLSQDESVIVLVDAGGKFAPPTLELGAPALAERARTPGLAALVINGCTHFAALWPEVEALADGGLATLALCPSYSSVAPAGGKEPLFGTSPMDLG